MEQMKNFISHFVLKRKRSTNSRLLSGSVCETNWKLLTAFKVFARILSSINFFLFVCFVNLT